MHLSMSSPRGLPYFYRGFDSDYCPIPRDTGILFQNPPHTCKLKLLSATDCSTIIILNISTMSKYKSHVLICTFANGGKR